MIIGFDGKRAIENNTGLGNYSRLLTEVLAAKYPDNKYLLYAPAMRELPLHTAVNADDTFTIQPQNVRFLQTSADWNWVLVETENGQQGWVHLDNFKVVELKKNVMDVFDGLYMAG